MSRPVLWSLYALLVVIWSSTWVAIKIGLEDTPPLLGADTEAVLRELEASGGTDVDVAGRP